MWENIQISTGPLKNILGTFDNLYSIIHASLLQTYIPPAFYDRDGKFYQPPSFEMPVGGSTKMPERNRKEQNGEPSLVEKITEIRALS